MTNTTLQNIPKVSAVQRAFARFIIKMMGWRLEGMPPDRAKMVMIGGPHTSNLDVFLMVMMAWAIGIRINFLVANDLAFPLNKLSVWANGIPIDRNNANNNTVDQVVAHMSRVDKCVLMIAPEGRLKRVEYWRSGFYYIAMEAGVPVVPGYMDYAKKLIKVGDAFDPSGDIDADMEMLRQFFEGVTARFPEKASPVRVRPRTEAMTKRLNERANRATDADNGATPDDLPQERRVGKR